VENTKGNLTRGCFAKANLAPKLRCYFNMVDVQNIKTTTRDNNPQPVLLDTIAQPKRSKNILDRVDCKGLVSSSAAIAIRAEANRCPTD